MKEARLIFWDFDGVIKDSVSVKTQAYASLFKNFGSTLSDQIRQHHDANGGMSRFDKIPLYLDWVGQGSGGDLVQEYCKRFSQLVVHQVIESPWVSGSERYLRTHHHRQEFVLVSATPQEELELIVNALDLTKCFCAIFGAPAKKKDVIHDILFSKKLEPTACLMIGDARTDLDAATANGVPFLLRKYSGNHEQFPNYIGAYIEDFSDQ